MNFWIQCRLFIENDQIHKIMHVLLSKIEFCEMQKQTGKFISRVRKYFQLINIFDFIYY